MPCESPGETTNGDVAVLCLAALVSAVILAFVAEILVLRSFHVSWACEPVDA